MVSNLAVAAEAALAAGAERVAILDWDVHHGNGTQHSFEDDPSVRNLISLVLAREGHQFLALYDFDLASGTWVPSVFRPPFAPFAAGALLAGTIHCRETGHIATALWSRHLA